MDARARDRRYLWKIEQKWTLGGLKINCRVATIDFQPSQQSGIVRLRTPVGEIIRVIIRLFYPATDNYPDKYQIEFDMVIECK